MKIQIIFQIVTCSLALLAPNIPCKCTSLLNQYDCTQQYTSYGCVWSTTSNTCGLENCSALSTLTLCNAAGNCWYSSKGVCGAFTGNCGDYNSTSAGQCGQVCTNGANSASTGCQQLCANGPTANADNSYTCINSVQYPPVCSSLTSAQCVGNVLCQVLANGTCADLTCSALTTTNCTFTTNTAARTINTCYLNGTTCQDATSFSQLNSLTCNRNSNDTYTWSMSSSTCQQCSHSVQLGLIVLLYILS